MNIINKSPVDYTICIPIIKKGVQWLYSPLKKGVNKTNLVLTGFTWLYHLHTSLNLPISTDNFINNSPLLTINHTNFSADPYYNIIAGLWSKPLIFGTNDTPLQSTNKFPVNVLPMPCNSLSLYQLISSIRCWKGRSEGVHINDITRSTIILDRGAKINLFSTRELLDGIHYKSSLKKKITCVSRQSFWCG